jgi:hypothetical protein
MHGFDTKLTLDVLNKSQAPNRDRFRPAIIASRQAIFQSLFNPLTVRFENLSDPQTRSTRD